MEVLDLAGRKGLIVGTANKHSHAWLAPRFLGVAPEKGAPHG